MKTIINKWTALLLAGIAFGACSEQTEYDDTSFSAVERLLYPSDGDQVDLIEQADANLYFEWGGFPRSEPRSTPWSSWTRRSTKWPLPG